MTNATIQQIEEAVNAPLADVPELAAIKEAVSKLDLAAAIEAVKAVKGLKQNTALAVAHRLADQKKGYGVMDCVDMIEGIVYEKFGEI